MMLYKKNNTIKLDKNLFENPSSEYRGAPFWAWNCALNWNTLEKQIDCLKEMGFGGFNMHTRSGMQTKYLSDEFMSLIKQCTEKAKKQNMLAWIYDEDRWPSGSAGGFVTKKRAFRQQYLIFSAEKKTITDKKIAILEGKTYFLAAFDILLNEDGTMNSYKVIGYDDEAKYIKQYAYVSYAKESGWFNNQAYVDTLSKDAIQEFINLTHEKYKEIIGAYFGNAVPAIFTDEPQTALKKPLKDAKKGGEAEFPWTADFPETFYNEYGIDIVEKIPELFFDLSENKISHIRYLYHEHICKRFVDSFVKQCGEWCDKNNIYLTGHMVEEPTLHSQTWAIGEVMRAYKYFGIPGIDMLCDDVELNAVKQVQSVVHQYGKEAMISELYGVTGWGFDFRGHKFQGDWQAALGVTVRVPHLSWVSMKGSAKRDYPASINCQSPWYKEYSYVENHFARLNTALTRGTPIVKVGIIHPIESYWIHYGPSNAGVEEKTRREDNFKNLTEWLLSNMVDFDFISESLLPDVYTGVEKKELLVGKMKYSTIVVPDCETLRKSTYQILCNYAKNGGRIIFIGRCPKYLDAKPNNDIESLYNKSEIVAFEKTAILERLIDEKNISVYDMNGNQVENLIHCLRKDGECYWLFLAHIEKSCHIDNSMEQKAVVTINGMYIPEIYNTVNGTIEKVSFQIKNNKTNIYLNIYENDSFLINLQRTDIEKEYMINARKEKVIEIIRFNDGVEYYTEEKNVCLLDMAEYSLDGEGWHNTEQIIRIDDKCRKCLGFPKADGTDVQPWVIEEEKIEHFVNLKFKIMSECEIENCIIAAEEISELKFNGEEISLIKCGYYVDESIIKYKLGTMKLGENIIEIKAPIGKRLSIENFYLLGDFSVYLRGCNIYITQKNERIGFGDITSQGLPFYGGNITYKCEFYIPTENESVLVKANRFRAPLIKAAIDGKKPKIIAYSPYVVRYDGLSKGQHTIEFTAYGNRENTFGPVHCCNYKKWYGPEKWYSYSNEFSAFDSETENLLLFEQEWTYEYELKKEGILSSPIVMRICDI